MFKLLVFTLLTITNAFSADRCVPNKEKIKTCQDFVRTLVSPAFYEDKTATKNEIATRFINDEKKAVIFLKKYVPTKFSISDNLCIFENIRKDCINPKVEDGPFGCEYEFPVLQYFRGLQRGLKLNKWSKSTKNLAEQIIQKHVKHIFSTKTGLIDVVIAFEIINNAQTDGYLKGVYKNATPFVTEGVKLSGDLGKMLSSMKKPYSCQQIAQLSQKEFETIDILMKKWKAK
jgi:hypothetical protein